MESDYQDLLSAFAEELRVARDVATQWWDGLLRAADPNDRTAAHAQVRLRWPAGPVSCPRIIAVYRKYYLQCETLNEQRESQMQDRNPAGWGEEDEEVGPEMVQPRALLLESLEAIDPELSRFMEGFVFSPIGTDLEGRSA